VSVRGAGGAAPALIAQDATKPRGRPRSEAVRQNVLRAASELLEKKGFKALTIEAIAERAGASKVTLYRWWPGKAAIVMDAFLASISPKVPFRRTGSAIEDLRQQMLAYVRLLSGRTGAVLAGLVAEGVLDAEVGEALRTRWIAARRVEGMKVIERGVAAGEIRTDVDGAAILDALYGPLYFRLLIAHDPLDEAFVESLWTLIGEGLRPRR
jgi:AcrR family transcriptional regulator